MAKVPFSINQEQCEWRGWWWRKGACYTTEDPAHDDEPYYDIPTAGVDITEEIPWYRDEDLKKDIMTDAGANITNHWIQLTQEPPPDDFLGKLSWYAGIGAQLIISVFTFPVGLAGFILEETLQTWSFSAYILWSAKDYEALQNHIVNWKQQIELSRGIRDNLGVASPIIFGAVTAYIQASAVSAVQFQYAAEKKILEQAEQDEELRQRILYDATYGQLRISSTPSLAEIWLEGVNTEKLTPETFKGLEERSYDIELRKFNARTEEWDIFILTTEIHAGKIKELHVRIPPGTSSDEEHEKEATTGTLKLESTPTSAQIWINGVDTEKLTPEVIKEITPGNYTILLKSYSRRTDEWTTYEFPVIIFAGKKLELRVNIPKGESEGEEGDEPEDETEEDILPEMIKAEVTGEYALDGDTFQTTTGERIRILGMDAPELGRPWADVARKYLNDRIAGKKVNLKIQSHKPLDTYDRTLAICTTSRGDITELMLSNGLARYLFFDDDIYDPTRYKMAEEIAKERRVGIWGALPPEEEIPPEEPTIPIIPGVEIAPLIEPIMLDAYVMGAEAVTGDVFSTDEGELVHILGINAPTPGEPLFEKSRANLDDYIKEKRVHLYIQSNRLLDEAGNTYAVAKVGAINMAIEQLRDGLAIQQTSMADIYDTREYIEHERLARAREIGIWGTY
jgi:endonuclease YncB( thermonuclease family)